MCGRYSETVPPDKLAERFKASLAAAFPARYNIAPSQKAPVVVQDKTRRLELFQWGLIPSWAKDPAIGHRMINARAETLLDKPSFRKPFQQSRCLVVADGFYEWRKGPPKTPFRVALKSREPLAMAGLYDVWKDPHGKEIRSFAIVTTEAAGSIKHIHERMPVIFSPAHERIWLEPASEPSKLLPLLGPIEDEALESYQVSTLVNSSAHDVPACVDKLQESWV